MSKNKHQCYGGRESLASLHPWLYKTETELIYINYERTDKITEKFDPLYVLYYLHMQRLIYFYCLLDTTALLCIYSILLKDNYLSLSNKTYMIFNKNLTYLFLVKVSE